jgi:WD40 repeat protein
MHNQQFTKTLIQKQWLINHLKEYDENSKSSPEPDSITALKKIVITLEDSKDSDNLSSIDLECIYFIIENASVASGSQAEKILFKMRLELNHAFNLHERSLDIPNEAYYEIFKKENLPDVADLLNVRLVCRSFYEGVSPFFKPKKTNYELPPQVNQFSCLKPFASDLSPNGQMFAVHDGKGGARICTIQGDLITSITGLVPNSSLAFTKDNKYLVYFPSVQNRWDKKGINIWNIAENKLHLSILDGIDYDTNKPKIVTLSDGNIIFCRTGRGINVVNPTTKETICFGAETLEPRLYDSMLLSPDETLLVGRIANTLHIFDIKDIFQQQKQWKQKMTDNREEHGGFASRFFNQPNIRICEKNINCFAITRDNNIIMSYGQRNSLVLWNNKTKMSKFFEVPSNSSQLLSGLSEKPLFVTRISVKGELVIFFGFDANAKAKVIMMQLDESKNQFNRLKFNGTVETDCAPDRAHYYKVHFQQDMLLVIVNTNIITYKFPLHSPIPLADIRPALEFYNDGKEKELKEPESPSKFGI